MPSQKLFKIEKTITKKLTQMKKKGQERLMLACVFKERENRRLHLSTLYTEYTVRDQLLRDLLGISDSLVARNRMHFHNISLWFFQMESQ